jgi:hypothetical protein
MAPSTRARKTPAKGRAPAPAPTPETEPEREQPKKKRNFRDAPCRKAQQPTHSTDEGIYSKTPFGTGKSPDKIYTRRRTCFEPHETTRIFTLDSIEYTKRGFKVHVYTKEDNKGFQTLEHHDIWKCKNGPEAVDEWYQKQDRGTKGKLLRGKAGKFFMACEDYVIHKNKNQLIEEEERESPVKT